MLKRILLEKPFIPLSCTILIISLVSVLKKGYLADVQIYDTYYVVPVYLFAGLFSIILALGSILYWFVRKKKLINQLTASHALGTIGISIYIMCVAGVPANSVAALGYARSIEEFQQLRDLNNRLLFGLLVVGGLQIIMLINVIRAVFRK